jgi:hypothetical protein
VIASGKAPAAAERLLTVAECAQLGAVAVVSIRRAIRRSELVASRIGHVLRIRLSDWENFLDSNRVTGRPMAVPAKKKAAAAANLPPARSA